MSFPKSLLPARVFPMLVMKADIYFVSIQFSKCFSTGGKDTIWYVGLVAQQACCDRHLPKPLIMIWSSTVVQKINIPVHG